MAPLDFKKVNFLHQLTRFLPFPFSIDVLALSIQFHFVLHKLELRFSLHYQKLICTRLIQELEILEAHFMNSFSLLIILSLFIVTLIWNFGSLFHELFLSLPYSLSVFCTQIYFLELCRIKSFHREICGNVKFEFACIFII